MSGLAQRIRQAREASAISIEDAERTLRIRGRYLKAIEAGDFAQLPDGPAGRGFVKNYARLLGMDPDEALSQFEAEYGVPIIQLKEDVPPPPERLPQQSEYTRVALPDLRWKGNMPDPKAAELDSQAVSEEIEMGVGVTVPEISRLDGTTGRAVVLRPKSDLRASRSSFRLKRSKVIPGLDSGYDSPKRMSGRPSMYRIDPMMFTPAQKYLPIVGGVLGAIALAAFAYFVLWPAGQSGLAALSGLFAGTGSSTASTNTQPFVPRVTIIAPVAAAPAAATAPAPDAAGTPAPAPDAPRESAVTVAPAPGGGLQIAIDARERVFVKVIIDGSLVFQGLPQLGPNPTWNASRSVVIETANAGAFDVIVNGERRGAPGQRNEKVRITYSL